MSETAYVTPTDALTDDESTTRRAVDEHARYIEEAYALPERRSFVLALAQFGVTPQTMVEVLDVSERMVREHWSLLHTEGANPQHYHDVFGATTPAFGALGTAEGIWPWPWRHAVTVEYDDPDTGASVRTASYRDTVFSGAGASADYLVVQEKTQRQSGLEETDRWRSVYPTGEAMARHLSSNAKTPWEYEANAHLIELTKGDANGEVPPDEVFGMTYEELPTLEGTVSGPNAPMAEHFKDTAVTIRSGHINWDYVRDESLPPLSQLDVRRTDDGLALR